MVGNQREHLILNLMIYITELYTAYLHSLKLSEYRIGIKLDKDPLAVEQNNHLTKIVNVYIA